MILILTNLETCFETNTFYNYKTWNTSAGADITLKYMCTKFMTAELEPVP